jgi:hypothetical protein
MAKTIKVKRKVVFGKLKTRKWQHAKNKMSKNKNSKNYHKPYRGQGR